MIDAVSASLLGTAVGGTIAIIATFLGPFLGAKATRRRVHDEELDSRRRASIIKLYGILTEVRAVLGSAVHASPEDSAVVDAAMARVSELKGALLEAAIFVEDEIWQQVESLRSHAWRAISHSNQSRKLDSHQAKAQDQWDRAEKREDDFENGYRPAQDALRSALTRLR